MHLEVVGGIQEKLTEVAVLAGKGAFYPAAARLDYGCDGWSFSSHLRPRGASENGSHRQQRRQESGFLKALRLLFQPGTAYLRPPLISE